jgi:hypothetical protein
MARGWLTGRCSLPAPPAAERQDVSQTETLVTDAELDAQLRTQPSRDSFGEWLWRFASASRRIQAMIACAAAQEAMLAWSTYSAPDVDDWWGEASVRNVVQRIEAWSQSGEGVPDPGLREHTNALARDVRRMTEYVGEASGALETCEPRDRTLSAARAVLAAGEAILWTPECIPKLDDAIEYEARVAHGSISELMEACRMAAVALDPESGFTRVVSAIRRALRGPSWPAG